MTRPHLFANSDPSTSRKAANELIASGRHDSQCANVLNLVRSYPGRTSAELAANAEHHGCVGLDRYTIARRLPDLAKRGKVRQGEARKCRRTGREALEWWPV